MRYILLIMTMVVMMACVITPTPNTVMPPTTAVATPPVLPPIATSISPTQPSGVIPGSPYDPKPGDAQLTRGNVFIDSAQMLSLQTFPVQVRLQIKGTLPTPCHQLRVKTSSASSLIQVEVYSVVDPSLACIQVLQEFNVSISLGSFASGKISVILNGKSIGEISP